MRALNKKKYVIIISLIGIVALISFCAEGSSKKEIQSISRPKYGALYKDYELYVESGGTKEKIKLTVNEKELTFDEAERLFAEGYDELGVMMKELNGDLNSISGDLKLPESVLDGILEIVWYSADTNYIEDNGELTDKVYKELPEDGVIVTMYAKVYAQEYTARFEVPVYLAPSNIEASRSMEDIIMEGLADAEKDQALSDIITLPEEIEGKHMRYYEQSESRWWKYPLLMIIVLFLYLFVKKHKEEAIEKERVRSLELSYAPIVTKLTLLTGAGSSIRGAWEHLADDYKSKDCVNAAYEEIVRVSNEMKNGMSEQQAYSIFGKRCRLPMYVRLGNLLEQNLRKGTKGLSERLEEEVREAFENRRAIAMRLGEEAGTKLVFPMLLLLIIVIVICVVPAFLCM